MSKHNFEVESGKSIKLLTKNKVCTEDIVVSAYGGNKIPDGYIKPEGSMPITENGTFDVRKKAEVNVQVVAKPEKPYIDSSKLKSFRYMFSKDTNADLSLLENLDTSEGINFSQMFYQRADLTTAPKLDTSNGTTFAHMFYECVNLTGEIELDTSNGTVFDNMFRACYKLEKIKHLNTEKATSLQYLFCFCQSLESVPHLETSKTTNMNQVYNGCKKITEVSFTNTNNATWFHEMFKDCILLVTVNGDLNLSKATNVNNAFYKCYNLENISFSEIRVFNDALNFADCSKLTVESLLSILNALSDNTGLATTYTVTLGSANLAKLTPDQKMIALNKNIMLQ